MPVTMRYSAALDQTYEESDPQSTASSSESSSSNLTVTPIVTTTGMNGNGSGGGGFESPASPSSHCSPSSLHSRTSSTDSLDDSVGSGGHSRQLSSDSTEFIPTRTVKTNAKPAFNPLQFVKTGAAPLYKKAVQQVKQYEDVRKVKEMVKEEEEAWQSNLDNWKSKRRQISSHTIQKAEEIKQIEEVEHNRQRKKSKTFSEMMEERSKRRPSSSVKLPVYDTEDADDVYDNNSFDVKDESRQAECSEDRNGLVDDMNASSKLNASFESSGSDQVFHDDEEELRSHSERGDNLSREVKSNGISSEGRNGVNGKPKKGATNGCNGDATPTEEYTFEKAIRSYTEYAESRTKTSRTSQSSETGEQTSFISSSSVTSDVGFESNRNSVASPYCDVKEASEDVRTPTDVVRREGDQLSAVVCLKRGGDCKDFGFTSKSIRGIGTGIFVESVQIGSPAENAGLKVDDEIMSINGECTSNRSHSAIVFAIKQAVYTGYLELQIYRYKNTDFLNVHQPSPCGNLIEVKVSRNGTPVDSPVRRRETSPKVDVMKRRSLFESSSVQSNDKQLHRRSLDLNNSRFRDKLASFENLDSTEQQHNTDRSKQTPERDLTFKKKLASFKSMDSLDAGGRGDHQLSRPSVLSVNVNVKHKLSSYENLNDGQYRHGERTKESPVQDKGALIDKWQSFERTKSCDHLDHYGSEDFVTPIDYDDTVTIVTSAEPPIVKVPLYESSSSDYDSLSKEPIVSSAPLSESYLEELLDMAPMTSIAEKDHDGVVDVSLTREVETMMGVVEFRSGFALAESLEETPIIGSQPSSPVTTEAEDEELINDGHCQIDELAMAENWLMQSEPTLSKDSERSLRKETLMKDCETSQPEMTLSSNSEKPHEEPTLSKDSESELVLSGDSKRQPFESILSRDSENSQIELAFSNDFESPQRIAKDLESLQCDTALLKDSESSQFNNFVDVLDDDHLLDVVDGDEDVDATIRKLVPPKEKPPPPPVELENSTNTKSVTVRRISSTKRIRKEIWRRRSDFLGIDADGVEEYIENEIKNVSPPPKMEEFLLEEKQLTEQCLQDQLTRRREQEHEFLSPTTPCQVSVPTETMAHTEANHEDEIARKEREIIEDLEREEQQGTEGTVLSERSEEEARLETERIESEEILRLDEERKLKEREELLSCQEERLRLEKEKLRKEQEDLLREKEAYQKQIEEHQRFNPSTVQHQSPSLLHSPPTNGPVSPEPREQLRSRLPPPPPPVKPKLPSPRPLDYMDGVHHRNSPPSSISGLQQPIHLQIDDETKPYNTVSSPIPVPPLPVSKSKQVLHALSASPRAKLMDSEQWLAKRKSDNSRNYNQQHWLVQEAEMRRILEQRELQHQQQQRVPAMQQQQSSNSEWPSPTSPKAAPAPLQWQSSNGSPNYVQQLPIAHNHPQLQQAPRMRPSVAPPLNTHSPHHNHHHHHHHHPQNNTQPIYGQTVGRLLPPPPPPPPPVNPQHKTSSAPHDGGSAAKQSPERDPQMLSVSGKKKCSHCAQELGRGAAMIIESLQLFYHIQCFQCCVCHVQLGNGTSGADVRVRNQKLHCHNCYSNDEGLKFSKV